LELLDFFWVFGRFKNMPRLVNLPAPLSLPEASLVKALAPSSSSESLPHGFHQVGEGQKGPVAYSPAVIAQKTKSDSDMMDTDSHFCSTSQQISKLALINTSSLLPGLNDIPTEMQLMESDHVFGREVLSIATFKVNTTSP
jgi:hypothetical protein